MVNGKCQSSTIDYILANPLAKQSIRNSWRTKEKFHSDHFPLVTCIQSDIVQKFTFPLEINRALFERHRDKIFEKEAKSRKIKNSTFAESSTKIVETINTQIKRIIHENHLEVSKNPKKKHKHNFFRTNKSLSNLRRRRKRLRIRVNSASFFARKDLRAQLKKLDDQIKRSENKIIKNWRTHKIQNLKHQYENYQISWREVQNALGIVKSEDKEPTQARLPDGEITEDAETFKKSTVTSLPTSLQNLKTQTNTSYASLNTLTM